MLLLVPLLLLLLPPLDGWIVKLEFLLDNFDDDDLLYNEILLPLVLLRPPNGSRRPSSFAPAWRLSAVADVLPLDPPPDFDNDDDEDDEFFDELFDDDLWCDVNVGKARAAYGSAGLRPGKFKPDA